MESQYQETSNVITKISKDNDEEAYLHALQLCTSYIVEPVIVAAFELDLFEIIAKGGGYDTACLSVYDIVSHLRTKNPNASSALKHMLYLLACHSLLMCSSRTLEDGKVEILYGLTPAGKFFVKNEDGVSLGPLSHLSSYRSLLEMCHFIKDAVLEGEVSFCKANKMTVFEYMGTDPKSGMDFDKAMNDYSTIVIKKILQTYHGFEGLESLVDVGGGIGTTLNLILSAYPSITGINFDLPRVLEMAPSYNTGIKHVGGDMFVEIPKGNAILLKTICHNWSDEQCLIILKNCYQALPNTGKVIVIDSILPETPNPTSLARCLSQFDNVMFAIFGAKERSEQEFEFLAKGAGFSNIRILCCVYGQWVIELYK